MGSAVLERVQGLAQCDGAARRAPPARRRQRRLPEARSATRATSVIGRPVWEYIAGGPLQTAASGIAPIARGELSGEAGLVCADGTTVTVQYAGHTEVVTGQRLVLFVALSTSRWGRHSRRDSDDGHARGAARRASARSCSLVAAGRDRAGDRRAAAHLARHRAHARAQRHGQGRRPVAGPPRRQGAGRRPRPALTPRRRYRTTAVWTSGARAPRMARPVRRVLSHESGLRPPAWRRPAPCGGSEEARGRAELPPAPARGLHPGRVAGRGTPGVAHLALPRSGGLHVEPPVLLGDLVGVEGRAGRHRARRL